MPRRAKGSLMPHKEGLQKALGNMLMDTIHIIRSVALKSKVCLIIVHLQPAEPYFEATTWTRQPCQDDYVVATMSWQAN